MYAYTSPFISNCSLFRRHSSDLAQELDGLRRRLNETTERLQNEKGETDEIGENARLLIEECEKLTRQIEELETESGQSKARTRFQSPESSSPMSPVSVPVSPRHISGDHQPHQLAPESPERDEISSQNSPRSPFDNPYCPSRYSAYNMCESHILDSDEEEICHNMPDCPDCGSKIWGVTCHACEDAYDHYYNNYNPRSSSPATTDCSGDPICHSDTDSD
jgi:hypothetical protein